MISFYKSSESERLGSLGFGVSPKRDLSGRLLRSTIKGVPSSCGRRQRFRVQGLGFRV